MSVYIDISEFLTEPRRSEMFRVTGALCAHWPDSSQLVPVKVRCNGRLSRLPHSALGLINDYLRSDPAGAEALRAQIHTVEREAESTYPMVDVTESDVLLCSDMLSMPLRLDFYGRLPSEIKSRCCFLVYDLLPLTHPEYLAAREPDAMVCRYYSVLRTMGHRAFFSKATQKAYYQRILRSSRADGQVLHPGTDTLGDRELRTGNKRSFVVIGSIEPGKRHALILEAVERLLQKVVDLELIFIGHLGPEAGEICTQIERFARDYPQFQRIEDVSDQQVRSYIKNARATICINAGNGFELAPAESLWVGTPVIASAGVPSLESYGGQGIHVVDPLSADSLREAVAAFLNETYHQQKLAEIRQLQLPTWAAFAAEVEAWVRSVPAAVPA